MNDVEHAVWQASLAEQVSDEDRSRGVALRGLQNDRVAAGDGRSNHPERNHDGEVEGRDRRNNANGLLDRVHVDTGRNLLVTLTLKDVQQACCELDVLEATGNLAGCVVEHLAVLSGHDGRELGRALLEQLAQVEEHVGALGEAGVAPAGQCCLCCSDCLLHGLDRRNADLVVLFARGGVVDRLVTLSSFDLFAANDVGNACHSFALPNWVEMLRRISGHCV